MSQIIKNLASSGPLPPSIPTSFVTDNGTAVPAANILIVHGTDSTENNSFGIIAKGGVAGTGTSNEVDVVLTNRFHGSGTTVGATTADLITFALGATPGTFFFNFTTAVFNASTPAGAGYDSFTTVRTDGATATIIGDTDSITHEDAALITTTAQVVVSGNNAIFRVGGVAGLSINWKVVGTYVQAN